MSEVAEGYDHFLNTHYLFKSSECLNMQNLMSEKDKEIFNF